MRSFKYANNRQYGGFNKEAVRKMTFEQFRTAHSFWGEDRNMPKNKRDEDLRSIYDKIIQGGSPPDSSHKGREKKIPDPNDLEKKEED